MTLDALLTILVTMFGGAIRVSTPFMFVALGETLTEKSGRINLGDTFTVFGLPEERLKNAAVRRLSVAENIAFRTFDKPPSAKFGWWLSPANIRDKGQSLIERYRIKTPSTETPIETSQAATFNARCWRANCRVTCVY